MDLNNHDLNNPFVSDYEQTILLSNMSLSVTAYIKYQRHYGQLQSLPISISFFFIFFGLRVSVDPFK